MDLELRRARTEALWAVRHRSSADVERFEYQEVVGSKSLVAMTAVHLAFASASDSCMPAELKLEPLQNIAEHQASEQESAVHKELGLDVARIPVLGSV